jgi:hypothetical protein
MLGRKLTIEQANQINGVFVSPETFINVVYDINDNPFIFLSEYWEQELVNTEFEYLVQISKEEYIAKPVEDILNQ